MTDGGPTPAGVVHPPRTRRPGGATISHGRDRTAPHGAGSIPRALLVLVLAVVATLSAVLPAEPSPALASATPVASVLSVTSDGTDVTADLLVAADPPAPLETPRPAMPAAILAVLLVVLGAAVLTRRVGPGAVPAAPGRLFSRGLPPSGPGPGWGAMPGLLRV